MNLRKAKIATVPTQITSRFEQQLLALKSRGYKKRAVLYQFQKVLLKPREEVMKKVERPKEEKAIILALPFDRRLPDDPFVIEARESYWIEQYRVLEEEGMNRRR